MSYISVLLYSHYVNDRGNYLNSLLSSSSLEDEYLVRMEEADRRVHSCLRDLQFQMTNSFMTNSLDGIIH